MINEVTQWFAEDVPPVYEGVFEIDAASPITPGTAFYAHWHSAERKWGIACPSVSAAHHQRFSFNWRNCKFKWRGLSQDPNE